MAYRAGRPFSKSEIKKYADNHKNHHKPVGSESTDKEQFRRAEYFSRDAIEDLLDSGCSGIRVYYGVSPEANGNIDSNGKDLMPRVFLVPVLEEGNKNKDIEFKPIRSKPDDEGKGGGSGSGGVGGGLPCPTWCEG